MLFRMLPFHIKRSLAVTNVMYCEDSISIPANIKQLFKGNRNFLSFIVDVASHVLLLMAMVKIKGFLHIEDALNSVTFLFGERIFLQRGLLLSDGIKKSLYGLQSMYFR